MESYVLYRSFSEYVFSWLGEPGYSQLGWIYLPQLRYYTKNRRESSVGIRLAHLHTANAKINNHFDLVLSSSIAWREIEIPITRKVAWNLYITNPNAGT